VALHTLNADGGGSWTEHVARRHSTAPAVTIAPTDLAVIVYTSGTTGRSKGAMITHGNLLTNARALIDAWRLDPSDVLLHTLPLFHIHGLFVALNTLLLAGGRVLLHAHFDAAAVVKALPHATVFMGVPTYYTRLLAEPAFSREIARLVRLFVCGSAPLLEQTFHAFEARTEHRVLERYGMSECGIIASNPCDGERIAGSVGRPLPSVECRIVDDTGAAVPAGTAGGIEVRGPNVCAGYWRNPEKTAADWRTDGFFVTGDIGRMDEHGYLHIVGRAKDLIISGGLNVYPKEIELVLDALPDVLESAVIGVPHPDFGEAVVAVVRAREDATPDPAALIAATRRQLAGFKTPKALFVIDALPRNAMGKVQKALLRDRYADLFAPSTSAAPHEVIA
jgi:malonyl-CoA/methylmalonyl-CoA synthetase